VFKIFHGFQAPRIILAINLLLHKPNSRYRNVWRSSSRSLEGVQKLSLLYVKVYPWGWAYSWRIN